MFGLVNASYSELTKEQQHRYSSVYCGICRQIRQQSSQLCRLGLSYDMAFLALLLMSLYEPEEESGTRACSLHPLKPRPWVDNEYIRYAADMNVALAYYKACDDWNDDKALAARMKTAVFAGDYPRIRQQYPRQCEAIEACIAQLAALEKAGCENPDEPANCFGRLMSQLLKYREDLWSSDLEQMGMALGRFIYLGDAVLDYRRDRRKKKYNPFLAQGGGENWEAWQQYLVLAMARCTEAFERLPLVQDKALLDNILYSGVWSSFRAKRKEQEDGHDQ